MLLKRHMTWSLNTQFSKVAKKQTEQSWKENSYSQEVIRGSRTVKKAVEFTSHFKSSSLLISDLATRATCQIITQVLLLKKLIHLSKSKGTTMLTSPCTSHYNKALFFTISDVFQSAVVWILFSLTSCTFWLFPLSN